MAAPVLQFDKLTGPAVHPGGPALVLAGPGAGKTRCIVERVGWLILQGVPPEDILCVTFSKDAASEMRRRIAREFDFSQNELRRTVTTFHSLALRILREEREALPWRVAKNPVAEDGRANKLARKAVGDRKLVGPFRSYMARQRRAMVSPELAYDNAVTDADYQFAVAYAVYDRLLREAEQVDFDGMVYWAVWLLESRPDIRVRRQFAHVIVDEAHDTAPDQQRLMFFLLGLTGNLFIVGDESQAIYGFRGASPEIFRQVPLQLPGTKTYFLAANHRSAQAIIDAFRPLAESKSLADRMHAVTRDRGLVYFAGFPDAASEAAGVALAILDAAEFDNTAVLARTNAQLVPVADTLSEAGVPVRWKLRFWSMGVVRRTLAALRLIEDPEDEDAQLTLARALGREFVMRLAAGRINETAEGSRWRWRQMQGELEKLGKVKMALPALIRLAADRLGLAGEPRTGLDAQDNPAEEAVAALAERAGRFNSISAFLEHAARMAKKTSRRGVTLSTAHRSKGAEWNRVFVIGVSEGLLPHRRAEDIGEERRLLYVAMSRAKRHLAVSWHGKPSPLLRFILPEDKGVTP